MDESCARFLAGSDGSRLLEAARATRQLPAHRRAAALAGEADPAQVRAALQQDDLRVRAAARCPHAERLLFTREALEQATAWRVAEERALRWEAPADVPLHDLGAGIGLDALATALSGRPVVAHERDPVRAVLLAANVAALGLGERVAVRTHDVRAARPAGALALLDPDRRPGGVRTRDPAAFEPPEDAWRDLLAPFERAMVKLPPITEGDEPFEIVSLDGRLRERRWFVGAWSALPARRALALPSGRAEAGDGAPWPAARDARPGDWLLDPDAAVVAAGLVGESARRYGLAPVHPRIPYLVGEHAVAAAPGHWMLVDAVLRPRPRELQAWLDAWDVGALTIRKRGVDRSVASWRAALRPRGVRAATLVITRGLDDAWIAYGCA